MQLFRSPDIYDNLKTVNNTRSACSRNRSESESSSMSPIITANLDKIAVNCQGHCDYHQHDLNMYKNLDFHLDVCAVVWKRL